jgi:hypothetical protein
LHWLYDFCNAKNNRKIKKQTDDLFIIRFLRKLKLGKKRYTPYLKLHTL